jgi:hypothetical protein
MSIHVPIEMHDWSGVSAAQFERTGFCSLDRIIPESSLKALREEARTQGLSRKPLVSNDYTFTATGVRGPRRYAGGIPGAELVGLHESASISNLASHLLGARAYATRAGYLYYEEGDYVGLHTDSPYCQLTIIAHIDGAGEALTLYPHLYRARDLAKLKALAAALASGNEEPGLNAPMARSGVLALLGRDLPHRRSPATAPITVAFLCYSTI